MKRRSFQGFNCMQSETNAIYHDAAVWAGISDSVQSVLYVMCENGGRCLQSDIYHQTGISRQTINSALRKLEREGIVFMEPGQGRNTVVSFTKQGQRYATEKVGPLFDAESEVLESWTEEEVRLYWELMRRYRDELRGKIDELRKGMRDGVVY